MNVVLMNKRIQELASLANCSIDGMGYGEGNIEKFAKLIIQECADVCYQHSENAGGADTVFGYGYKDCGDDIKRIFGVK